MKEEYSWNDSQEIKQALKKMPKKTIIGMVAKLVELGTLGIEDLDKAVSETGLGLEGLFRMKDFDMKHKWELKQVFTDLKSRVNLILELIDERGVPKNWSMRRKMALSILISGLVIDVPSWRDLDERSEEFKRCWESYREEKFEE